MTSQTGSSDFSDFMPHGMCYLWEPEVLWLHIAADLTIAFAYFSISLTLVYFLHRGGKLPFKWVIWLFSAFILACGVTHMMNIWTIWHPDYYWAGFIKVLTAVASILTAMALWPIVRKAIALPNLFSLQEANEQLVREIEQRKIIEHDLKTRTDAIEHTNNELTKLNHLMTGRELNMIKLKEEVNELCRALGRPLPYAGASSLTQSG